MFFTDLSLTIQMKREDFRRFCWTRCWFGFGLIDLISRKIELWERLAGLCLTCFGRCRKRSAASFVLATAGRLRKDLRLQNTSDTKT